MHCSSTNPLSKLFHLFQWIIPVSVLKSSYRAWNPSLLKKDYSINWDIYITVQDHLPGIVKRIPLVMDDNDKGFKNVEHLFEWLCCCKLIHLSLNWRIFWITHLLVNLLFWGAVTTPKTSKIKSFAKIVFSNVHYCYKVLHLRCLQGSWLRLCNWSS